MKFFKSSRNTYNIVALVTLAVLALLGMFIGYPYYEYKKFYSSFESLSGIDSNYGHIIDDSLANTHLIGDSYLLLDNSSNPYEDGNIRVAVLNTQSLKTLVASTDLPGTFDNRECTVKPFKQTRINELYFEIIPTNSRKQSDPRQCSRTQELYEVNIASKTVKLVDFAKPKELSSNDSSYTDCFEFSQHKVCATSSQVDYKKINPWDGSVQGALAFSSGSNSTKLCCGMATKLRLIGFNNNGDYFYSDFGIYIIPRTYFLEAIEAGKL